MLKNGLLTLNGNKLDLQHLCSQKNGFGTCLLLRELSIHPLAL